MIQFYAPDIEVNPILPQEESVHCCRVLRAKAGDLISVVDGSGGVYECRVVNPNPKGCEVEVVSKTVDEQHWQGIITLAVAPTKNLDRMEWLAEKCVEIGVSRLIFVDCKRNVRHNVKPERIRRIMVSAMKQSLKSRMPEIVVDLPVADLLNSKPDSALRCFGYCSDEVERVDFSHVYTGKTDLILLIGPEGDFAPEEVDAAMQLGWKPVTFGNTRLRTETAALFALCASHTIQNLTNK